MNLSSNIVLILLVFLMFQKVSRASRCYQCNSKKDSDCTISKVDIKYLKPCPRSQPYCRKAVYIYYFTDSREYRTVRECAKWRNAGKDCYRGRYTRDSYQLVCECKGAGCNRSPISPPLALLPHLLQILSLLVAFLLLSPT